jgi:hypothetical protein
LAVGRNGKHKQVAPKILSDLDHLPEGAALNVLLAELLESKENVRLQRRMKPARWKRNGQHTASNCRLEVEGKASEGVQESCRH